MWGIEKSLKHSDVVAPICIGGAIGMILAMVFGEDLLFIGIILITISLYLLFLSVVWYQRNKIVNIKTVENVTAKKHFLDETSQYIPSAILKNIHSRDLPQHKVSLVGLGCAGINMIDFIVKDSLKNLDTITIDTDLQKLSHSKAKYCLYLGNDRDNVKEICNGQIEDLYQFIKKSQIVFLLTGLGGSTGGVATLQLTQYAIKMRKTVHVLAVTPFKSEGHVRNKNAILTLQKLKTLANSVTAISNNDLARLYGRSTKITDGFNIIHAHWLNIVSAVHAKPRKHKAIIFNQVKTIKSKGFRLV